MTKKMYRILTKWDMGLEDYVYHSKEDAWRDLGTSHNLMGVKDDFEDYIDEGLYSVKELTVVEFEGDN